MKWKHQYIHSNEKTMTNVFHIIFFLVFIIAIQSFLHIVDDIPDPIGRPISKAIPIGVLFIIAVIFNTAVLPSKNRGLRRLN